MSRLLRRLHLVIAIPAAFALSGCAMLEPQLPKAEPDIASAWPTPVEQSSGTTAAADIAWNDFFVDPNLKALIGRALERNRDLRVAVLNVERARAQYGIQRAGRFPTVEAGVSGTRAGGDRPLASGATSGVNSGTVSYYSATLGVTNFELDLFGRVRNLSEAALQSYFATEEAQRAAHIALIAEVARAYLTLSADVEQQRIAQATLDNYSSLYDLTVKRHELGAISGLDLQQVRTQRETARADAAHFAGLVAQDTNALALLTGGTVDAALLPQGFAPQASGLQALPAGLPSDILLRRPDILQAERQLRAANANIGAARAAFFPTISLTGSVGSTSTELSGLFDSGSSGWSFMPQITLPIFAGGRLRSGLAFANVNRDIALAQYEKAIQSGFREVADALALNRTLAEQRAAQEALLDAATRAHELSQVRYKAGQDSYIVLLDAQRTLYGARQGLATTQLAEQANRITLYKVRGGGWWEETKNEK